MSVFPDQRTWAERVIDPGAEYMVVETHVDCVRGAAEIGFVSEIEVDIPVSPTSYG
jgi:hypothetical protein